MKILVINSGSSSIKYQIIDMSNETVLAKGLVEDIGGELSKLKHEPLGSEIYVHAEKIETGTIAIDLIMEAIVSPEHGVLKDISEIAAIGHRVVSGGERYTESVIIDDACLEFLSTHYELAPLHNPGHVMGMRACKQEMPGVPMVAVFDTAFHQTMAPEAYLYALPYEYYENHKIRRYGFHGTSHKYVSQRAAVLLGTPVENLDMITCHLGNGASLAAVKNGKCIDTSMGYTPLAGLVMGTRSGDIDPSVITLIMEKENLTAQEVLKILNNKSGLIGISGVSSDMRTLKLASEAGNDRAELALAMFARRVKGYIGNYMAQMNGTDAIIFTAGIGENDAEMRSRICEGLSNLGIKLDEEKNLAVKGDMVISTDDSHVKIMVIGTNEEMMIARETDKVIKEGLK